MRQTVAVGVIKSVEIKIAGSGKGGAAKKDAGKKEAAKAPAKGKK
jgi:hypothetical protein